MISMFFTPDMQFVNWLLVIFLGITAIGWCLDQYDKEDTDEG